MSSPPRNFDRVMKRDALLATFFFRSMRTEEVDEIVSFSTERRFTRGTVILKQGDPGTNMMAVLVGRVRASNVSIEGKEITVNMIGPGEVFGEIALLDGKPRSADVTAIEDTTVIVVERREFLPFVLRHEKMVERLLVTLCDRLRQTSIALEEIALFDVPARLARLLMKMTADYGQPIPREQGGGTRIDFKISQTEIGRLIATTRESVNKQLKLWRADGIVDCIDQKYTVYKPEALKALFE